MHRHIAPIGILLVLAAPAFAQTGVSDDRVSLPDGPGSLEGVGEDVAPNPNMGTMSWSVPIRVVPGFPGVTPQLALSYDSGAAGSGPVGVGWSLGIPTIERSTYRGLPKYQPDDDFVIDGEQLVKVADGPRTYRARFERAFVRYRWMADPGDGAGGYWIAEYPDGRRGYFGADAGGSAVPEARDADPVRGGVFKYHLVEVVDVHGHHMKLSYQKDGNVSLIQRIAYVFVGGDPRYQVTFRYEAQQDATGESQQSDCRGGFDLRLTQRLAEISVFSGQQRIRRYRLTYEPYADAGGFTRLTRVETLGARDEVYPIVFDFTYSRALGGVCGGELCDHPYVVDMGRTGVDVESGRATLLDINGDALPDLLSTPPQGNHRFYLNVPAADGRSHFDVDHPVQSRFGGDSFRLGEGPVQPLDVNGDGFTDLLNARTGAALFNEGRGDWARQAEVAVDQVGDAGFDVADGDLTGVRFLDYDDDKRIDLLRSTRMATSILRNEGGGRYVAVDGVQPLGAGVQEDDMEFSDMNGDGLLDPIVVRVDAVRYWLSLGYGRWSDPIDMPAPIDAAERPKATLEDLNGDGLADLVIVNGGTVEYAINRNGRSFFAVRTLTSADVPDLPVRGDHTTVLLADMNANGSEDIVWIEPDGTVRYLELFPVRPNLLSHIENGAGLVMDVHYAASAQQLALDGGTWPTPLPHPMLVVDQVDAFDRLSNVHEIDRYRYHDGFYDGAEKQFRGYRVVDEQRVGDEGHESGIVERIYDVGDQDPYRHGLLGQVSVSSGGEDGSARLLRYTDHTYDFCPLAEVPPEDQLAQPVRFACETRTDTVVAEGDEPHQVITSTRKAYDGYGNVVHDADLGVASLNDMQCDPCDHDESVFGAPCGVNCTGDEAYVDTDYVPPGAATNQRWILHAPVRRRTYGRPGGLATETTTFYDGPPFVGLDEGHLDLGDVTRVQVKVSDDRVIQRVRNRYDADGNVVATLDPLGTPDGDAHGRRYTYDDEGLHVIATELLAGGRTLRRETSYDPLFRRVSESTAWMLPGSPRRSTFFTYDQHGRLASRVLPGGDTLDDPTEQAVYELGSPVSRVVVRRRSQVGGPYDLEAVQCLDGRGRKVQTRTRIRPGLYRVSGFTLYDHRSVPVRVYQPYEAESGDCEDAPPPGVAFQTYTYDATGRLLTTTEPDADLYGTPTVSRFEYWPLATLKFDGDDTDPASPFHDTPTTTRVDGLGRVVSIERRLDAVGDPARVTLRYDELGRLSGVVDPLGNEKTQTYDLTGRVLAVDDPDAGDTTFTYDDAGNLVEQVDARGVVVRQAFDGLNRRVARWDDADEAGTKAEWVYDAAPDCAECTNAEGRRVEARYPGADLGLSDAPGRDRLGYDARGREVWRERVLEGHAFVEATAYDDADRPRATTYPDGRVVRRTYDDASRLTAIDGVAELRYDPRGLPAEAAYADGTSDAWGWDARMRLASLRTTGPAGEVLQGFDYARDRFGVLTRITDAGHAQGPGGGAALVHDAWHRLTDARYDGGEVVHYAFDAADDVTAAGDATFAYGDAGPHALTAAGDVRIAYDEAGRVVRRGDLALDWDHLGRLVAGGDARFAYDGDVERVARSEQGSVTDYAGPDFEVRDGVAALYVRAGGRRVARLESAAIGPALLGDADGNGEVDAGDAWAVQSGRPGAPVDRLLWAAVRRQLAEDAPTFLHADHLGSLTLATAGGAVVGQRAFSPTGDERPGAFGEVDAHGFTGQERDASTGLLHFRFRYLDPRTGRWTAPDPAFEIATAANVGALGESTAAYAYVANDFADGVDPTGLVRERAREGGQSRERPRPDRAPPKPAAPIHHTVYARAEGFELEEPSFVAPVSERRSAAPATHGPGPDAHDRPAVEPPPVGEGHDPIEVVGPPLGASFALETDPQPEGHGSLEPVGPPLGVPTTHVITLEMLQGVLDALRDSLPPESPPTSPLPGRSAQDRGPLR